MLKSGFLAATCDLVLFADAAGQCDVVRLDRLALLSRAYDIVCGGGVARRQPPMRTAYFKLFNRLQAALSAMDLGHASRGLKLFHRESLLNLTPVAVDLSYSPRDAKSFNNKRAKARDVPQTQTDPAKSSTIEPIR